MWMAVWDKIDGIGLGHGGVEFAKIKAHVSRRVADEADAAAQRSYAANARADCAAKEAPSWAPTPF